MSYHKPDTGNSMNDYFTSLRDFGLMAPRLLTAGNRQSFEIWLDKLDRIDRRALVLYLKENKERIPKEHWERARARLPRYLRDGGDDR